MAGKVWAGTPDFRIDSHPMPSLANGSIRIRLIP